jgi:hypothetical protein
VLAEKKVGDDKVLWADNCDITGNTLRCGELEEELQKLLLGGGETDGASSCRIVEDGQETADRLAQVFHTYDDEDRGYLAAEEVCQCMAAVGIKPELAPAAINAMSQDEFVGLFAQLVRRQDEHVPVGTLS